MLPSLRRYDYEAITLRQQMGESVSDEELHALEKHMAKARQQKERMDKIVARYSNLVSKGDVRTSMLGRAMTIIQSRDDMISNIIKTSKQSLADAVMGAKIADKQGLKAGTLRKASIFERAFTGELYTDTGKEVEEPAPRPSRPDPTPEPAPMPEPPEVVEPKVAAIPSELKVDTLTVNASNVRFNEEPTQEVRALDDPLFLEELIQETVRSMNDALAALPEEVREQSIRVFASIDEDKLGEIIQKNLGYDDDGEVMVDEEGIITAVEELTKAILARYEVEDKRLEEEKRESLSEPDAGPEKKVKEKAKSLLDRITPTFGIGALLPAAAIMGKVAAVAGSILAIAADGILGAMKSEEWGTSKVAGALGGILGSTMDGMLGAMWNGTKWGMAGATAGLYAAGPVGMIAGGILGASLGALLGFIGGEKIAKLIDGVPAVMGQIVDNITGAFKDGYNFLLDRAQGYYDGLKSTINKVAEIFSVDFWDKKISEFGDFARDKFDQFMKNIKDFVTQLFTIDYWTGGKKPKNPSATMQSLREDAVNGVWGATKQLTPDDTATTMRFRPAAEQDMYRKFRNQDVSPEDYAKYAAQRAAENTGDVKKMYDDLVARNALRNGLLDMARRKREEFDASSVPAQQRAQRVEKLNERRREVERLETQPQPPAVGVNQSSVMNSGNKTINAFGMTPSPYNSDPTAMSRLLDLSLNLSRH